MIYSFDEEEPKDEKVGRAGLANLGSLAAVAFVGMDTGRVVEPEADVPTQALGVPHTERQQSSPRSRSAYFRRSIGGSKKKLQATKAAKKREKVGRRNMRRGR